VGIPQLLKGAPRAVRDNCNVVVADDVVELETIELVLELADF
jgi:hypothetical protein